MLTIGRVLFTITHLILCFAFYTNWSVAFTRYFDYEQTNSAIPLRLTQLFLFGMTFCCYYKASYTIAGPVTIKKPPEPELCPQLAKLCSKCQNAWKPPRAHHCKTCKTCVFRMDHHCEWINNCVGSHNQKYFMLFLFYTFLFSFFTFTLNILVVIYWVQQQKRGLVLALLNVSMTKVQIGGLLILCIFFLIFTGEFLYTQIEVIADNQTTVESYKEVYGKPDSFSFNFLQVFGDTYWLLPTKPNIKMNYLELLYDPEYLKSKNLYLETDFYNPSSQFYEFFSRYQVLY